MTVMTKRLVLLLLFVLAFVSTFYGQGQAPPTGFVPTYAFAGMSPNGLFAHFSVSNTGALVTTPTSGTFFQLSGYIGPVAPVAQDSAGNWHYLLVDGTGALKTTGTGGGSSNFSALTADAPNTSGGTFQIGNSTSLAPTGTGVINANQVNGASLPTSKAVVGTDASGHVVDAFGSNVHSLVFANNTSSPGFLGCGSVNGTYQVVFVITASAAVDPTCVLPGVLVNTQTGSSYPLAVSDRGALIRATTGSTFLLTLLQITGNAAFNLPFILSNENTDVATETANAADSINGGSLGGSAFVPPGDLGFNYQDTATAPGNTHEYNVPTETRVSTLLSCAVQDTVICSGPTQTGTSGSPTGVPTLVSAAGTTTITFTICTAGCTVPIVYFINGTYQNINAAISPTFTSSATSQEVFIFMKLDTANAHPVAADAAITTCVPVIAKANPVDCGSESSTNLQFWYNLGVHSWFSCTTTCGTLTNWTSNPAILIAVNANNSGSGSLGTVSMPFRVNPQMIYERISDAGGTNGEAGWTPNNVSFIDGATHTVDGMLPVAAFFLANASTVLQHTAASATKSTPGILIRSQTPIMIVANAAVNVNGLGRAGSAGQAGTCTQANVANGGLGGSGGGSGGASTTNGGCNGGGHIMLISPAITGEGGAGGAAATNAGSNGVSPGSDLTAGPPTYTFPFSRDITQWWGAFGAPGAMGAGVSAGGVGGTGGNGGGVAVFMAPSVFVAATGSISCNGGAGGNGTTSGTGGSGGGGGGGGSCGYIAGFSLRGTNQITASAGGAGTPGTSAGTSGTGGAGNVIAVEIF